MKIIEMDNFNRDNISDILIAENVHVFYVDFIVKALNKSFSGDKKSPDFFRAVDDDYKLYVFKP